MSPIERPDPPASIDYHRDPQHQQLPNHQHQPQQHQPPLYHHFKQPRQRYQPQLHLHHQRDEPKSIVDHHLSFSDHLISTKCDSDTEKLKDNDDESDDNNNIHNTFRICENYNDLSTTDSSTNGNNKDYLKDHLYETIDDLPKCECNRQLFGIQLEVTSLLLEAERRKLAVLQRELQAALEDSGSIKKAKEQIKQELILAISRIQVQYDLLETEYKHHAIGRLRSSNTRGLGKSNRSQPAIGLKQTPKSRRVRYDKQNISTVRLRRGKSFDNIQKSYSMENKKENIF